MTEFAEDLRHRCRNPRCWMKVTAPGGKSAQGILHARLPFELLPQAVPCLRERQAGRINRQAQAVPRPKCEGRYRKNSARYSFLGADTTSAANVPRSAQSTGIKKCRFRRPTMAYRCWPENQCGGLACTALPVDPETARRSNAANDWGHIRKESAWSKPRPPAPKEMQSDWRPCSPSVPVADDLSIPEFLKREPVAFSKSPDGILEAAEFN